MQKHPEPTICAIFVVLVQSWILSKFQGFPCKMCPLHLRFKGVPIDGGAEKNVTFAKISTALHFDIFQWFQKIHKNYDGRYRLKIIQKCEKLFFSWIFPMKRLSRSFPTVESFESGFASPPGSNHSVQDVDFTVYLAIFCGSFACESHVNIAFLRSNGCSYTRQVCVPWAPKPTLFGHEHVQEPLTPCGSEW